MNVLKRIIPVIVGLFVLPFFAQSAHANPVDFLCGPPLVSILPCAGTIGFTFSGTTLTAASTAGVTVSNDAGPDLLSNFLLVFNTAGGAPNISLTEVGGDGSTLMGTIALVNGFTFGSSTTVNLGVEWTSLPLDFQTFLGSPTGEGVDTNIILTVDNTAQSVDVNIQPIQPTPEPTSLLLLGTGLLGLGGAVRRRLFQS
jgi:hypothetical protein